MLNNDFVVLTTESLKKITYGIRSLQQEQRELVREALHPYVGKKLWEADLRKLLREFKENHQLSNIDIEGIRDAFSTFE